MPVVILGTSLICSSDTPRHLAFLLVALLKVMVNKMVIEFDEQNHVFGIGQVGRKVGIGVRCECLL